MAEIITGNSRLLKDLNSNVILNLVRTNAPISGAELAKITGMQPSTVHNILKYLAKNRMVRKIGIGDSTKLGGRRPTLWKIRGNYGYIIGIHLEIDIIELVLVDLNSKRIDHQRIVAKSYQNLADLKEKLVVAVDTILKKNNVDKSRVLGIGFGTSGLVDVHNGIIRNSNLLPKSEPPINFTEYLINYFEVPIYVENDTNAAVLAEKWFGKAQDVENIVYMHVSVDPSGFRIGFGLILNNKLYRGSNMYAGETQMFNLNIEKILRKNCGCADSYLAIGEKSIELKELDLQKLIEALKTGNEYAIRFFREIGMIVGKELANAIIILDPKMAIIGGEILEVNEFILDPIRQTVNDKISKMGNRDVRIVGSSLSKYSVALGAATIVLKKIFQNPSLVTTSMRKAV